MEKSVILNIRPASLDDAVLLAALGARTFRDAFGADNDPEDLEAYLDAAFSVDKMREELREPTARFFIAFDESHAIGYAKLRAVKKPDCVDDPSPVELERIYVDQRYIGRGVGAVLMQRALDEAGAAGYRTIWLGVWEKNESSIAFYKKWGYEIVGEHEFVIGSDVQQDHIMTRSLDG